MTDLPQYALRNCPYCGSRTLLKEEGTQLVAFVCEEGSSCKGSGLMTWAKRECLQEAVFQYNGREADTELTRMANFMMADVHEPEIAPETLPLVQETAEAMLDACIGIVQFEPDLRDGTDCLREEMAGMDPFLAAQAAAQTMREMIAVRLTQFKARGTMH